VQRHVISYYSFAYVRDAFSSRKYPKICSFVVLLVVKFIPSSRMCHIFSVPFLFGSCVVLVLVYECRSLCILFV
jgi:hypothetical protein